jgi:hypothetical protein
MPSARGRVSSERVRRSGLTLVPDPPPPPPGPALPPLPGPAAAMARQSIIYAIPIWEINAKTGMVILYEADPYTGQHLLDAHGELRKVAEVPSAQMARSDAQPRVVWDYVGQTVRELWVREGEHHEDKSWEDVIAGPAVIVEQGMWDKEIRDRKEILKILQLKPRFNHDHNLDNSRRIEIWRQIELRHARDDALRRPRWIPLEQRTALAELTAEQAVILAGLDGREPRYPLTVLAGMFTAAWRRVACWPKPVRLTLLGMLLWMAGVGAGFLGLTELGWPTLIAAGFALMACTVLALAIIGRGRKRRRRRRR